MIEGRLTRPDDVAANREGRLTQQQRAELLAAKEDAAISAGVWGGIVGAIAAGAIASQMLIARFGDALAHSDSLLLPFGVALLLGATTGGCCVFSLWRQWWRTRLSEPAPVVTAMGAVSWDGKRYRARAGLRRLSSPYGDLDLTPGAYRFHTIRGTGTLVSAEELDGAPESLARYREIIRAADLADQAEPYSSRVRALAGGSSLRLWRSLATSALMVAVLVGVWLVMVLDLLPGFRKQLGDGAGTPVILTLVVIGVPVWQLFRMRSLWIDIRSGAVTSVEGIVTKSADLNDPEAPLYYLHVCGTRLSVTVQVHDALIPGRRYRVRFTPRSRTLVGIEPLE